MCLSLWFVNFKSFLGLSINCTFDNGLCDFFEVRTDNFDWIWTNQSTPTIGTGPDRDHTSGTGYYMYIETSLPQKPGDVADLTSGLQVKKLLHFLHVLL